MSERDGARHALTIGLTSRDVYGQPPMIQSTKLLKHLRAEGWDLVRTDAPPDLRPQPVSWLDFEDRIEGLIATGIATTRSRTSSAIGELGLNPTEVRAVVIEQHTVRVYRWSDVSHAQTIPILEDPCEE